MKRYNERTMKIEIADGVDHFYNKGISTVYVPGYKGIVICEGRFCIEKLTDREMKKFKGERYTGLFYQKDGAIGMIEGGMVSKYSNAGIRLRRGKFNFDCFLIWNE